MTIIAAVKDDSGVWIAGDRSMSNEDVILQLSLPKIKKINNTIVGYCGSQGIGQRAFTMLLPEYIDEEPNWWVEGVFINNMIKKLEDCGLSPIEEENNTQFLVCFSNYLYEVDTSDWSYSAFDYTAIGTGSAIALGSLHTTDQYDLGGKDRVSMALQSSIYHSPSCIGPIDILNTHKSQGLSLF